MEHIFQVTGMTCGHCERAVQQALLAVDSNSQIRIDRIAQQVVVQNTTATREALSHAIREEGYHVA